MRKALLTAVAVMSLTTLKMPQATAAVSLRAEPAQSNVTKVYYRWHHHHWHHRSWHHGHWHYWN
jgi:hypothetical protein